MGVPPGGACCKHLEMEMQAGVRTSMGKKENLLHLQGRVHDCYRHFKDLHRGLPGLDSCRGGELRARSVGEELQEIGEGGGRLDGVVGEEEALYWDRWNECTI